MTAGLFFNLPALHHSRLSVCVRGQRARERERKTERERQREKAEDRDALLPRFLQPNNQPFKCKHSRGAAICLLFCQVICADTALLLLFPNSHSALSDHRHDQAITHISPKYSSDSAEHVSIDFSHQATIDSLDTIHYKS